MHAIGQPEPLERVCVCVSETFHISVFMILRSGIRNEIYTFRFWQT